MLFTSAVSFADTVKYQTVAVISIDALHPDAVQKNFAPNIFKLIDSGFYTPKGMSAKPPKKLISHAALLTGLTPEQNGKTDNNWQKGEKRGNLSEHRRPFEPERIQNQRRVCLFGIGSMAGVRRGSPQTVFRW